MKNRLILWSSLMVLLLSGCAGSLKMLPDGTYVGIATVGDTLDRSASAIGHYKVIGKQEDGSPIFEQINKLDLSVGPTVGGQAIVGATGGFVTAATQGVFGLAIAKEQKCSGSNCGGAGTVIYNEANSQSLSEAMIKMNVNASAGGACNTLACTGK